MELIRDVINFIATGLGGFGATLAPYAFIGLVGLYLLWLVIGYLRVSQVGVRAEATALPALPLRRAADGAIDVPRGVAYCPNDGLRYPGHARFCTRCEADLLVSCANCSATIRAADESCYRCGTHDTLAAAAE
ncbi:MAG TPA: zinc ribbon domain-containing protein [Candidatus Limnocylindria bacterium]